MNWRSVYRRILACLLAVILTLPFLSGIVLAEGEETEKLVAATDSAAAGSDEGQYPDGSDPEAADLSEENGGSFTEETGSAEKEPEDLSSAGEEPGEKPDGETEDAAGTEKTENGILSDSTEGETSSSSQNTAENTEEEVRIVTQWSWKDAGDRLQETEGRWGLGAAGASREYPLTADKLEEMLPAQITAVTDGGEVLLDLLWDFSDVPEEGIWEGSHLFAAELPEGYVLAEKAQKLEVTVELGEAEKMEVKNLENSIVEGVSPVGTTIDVFDYWLDGQDSPDNVKAKEDPDWDQKGINKDHRLKFGNEMAGGGAEEINRWTKGKSPRKGIVQKSLSEKDGYPVLSGEYGGESLAYLFDPDKKLDGKASYPGATGLLQVDEDGYYYYDSTENFAEFKTEGRKNYFVLYKGQPYTYQFKGAETTTTGAVATGGSSPYGQFFPFNAGTQVYRDSGDGILLNEDIKATNKIMNHYFGLHMSTRFVQQYGGHIDEEKTKPVTYEFSGDDDVWVFIDGVLVADLGGIHDKASLKIDFSTGEIFINDTKQEQTLGELLGTSQDTLLDDTYHTLDFYYLERGNTDSNMSLKYNLVTIPESSLIKVDQTGEEIAGVTFKLYQANANYQYEENNPIASGTTDASGSFVFKNDEQQILNLNKLYEDFAGNDKTAYFVLKEVNVPEGYRSAGEIQFRLVEIRGEFVVPLSSNQWETGAYAMANANVSTGSKITLQDSYDTGKDLDTDGGTAFAVIIKLGENGKRQGVITGDVENGFTVEEQADTTGSILSAVQKSGSYYTFHVDSSGAYKTVIENLPGDVTQYKYMLQNEEQSSAEYEVIYYYTEADSVMKATEQNTWQIQSDAFERVFSTNIYVPNIKNHLLVQKITKEDEQPLDGAEFCLFSEKYISDILDDEGNLKKDADLSQAIDTVTTQTGAYQEGSVSFELKGGAVFPSEGKVLAKGVYYLVETKAPDGYEISTKPVKVIVDDTGVYADAGEEQDGVKVIQGVGSLVRSMVQFATEDLYGTDGEPPIQKIQAVTVSGTRSNSSFSWSNPDWNADKVLHLDYQAEGRVLSYGPATPGAPITITTDKGWSRMVVKPENPLKDHNGKDVTDITNLFSGTTTVQISDRKLKSITVKKTWVGDDENQRPGDITAELYNGDRLCGSATLNDENGWSYTWTGLSADGQYTVKEIPVEGYTSTVTGSAEDGFVITNSRNASLTVQKVVTGAYGDKTREFPFTVTLQNQGNPVSGTYTVTGKDSIKKLTFNDQGEARFCLKDGESITIKDLPSGITYTVAEDAEGYTQTYFIDGRETDQNRAEGTLSHGNVSVKVENKKEVVPDTGVRDWRTPGAWTAGAALLLGLTAGGAFLWKGRRREGTEKK